MKIINSIQISALLMLATQTISAQNLHFYSRSIDVNELNKTIHFSGVVSNFNSSEDAAPSMLAFAIKDFISEEVTLIGQYNIPALGALINYEAGFDVTIDLDNIPGLASNSYYPMLIIDVNQEVSESNEADNIWTSSAHYLFDFETASIHDENGSNDLSISVSNQVLTFYEKFGQVPQDITIFDMTGKVVYTATMSSNQIELPVMQSGVYTLVAVQNGQRKYFKFFL